MEEIISMQNPAVKRLSRMRTKAPYRKKSGLIWVEGMQEISHALENDFVLAECYYANQIADAAFLKKIIPASKKSTALSSEIISKISYRGHTEGIIGLFEIKQRKLTEFNETHPHFILVLESVEKPGNLGAVLRTADAAGAAAVFICNPHTDIFHPNVIRASVGASFTVNLFQISSEEAIQFLKKNEYKIFASALRDTIPYHQADFSSSCAIVMGTESTGLSNDWLEAADSIIKIPMLGKIDSLNVSNSTAILAYEAARQLKKF